jgi:hypothetical protein
VLEGDARRRRRGKEGRPRSGGRKQDA